MIESARNRFKKLLKSRMRERRLVKNVELKKTKSSIVRAYIHVIVVVKLHQECNLEQLGKNAPVRLCHNEDSLV